jgi:hypothetical protein
MSKARTAYPGKRAVKDNDGLDGAVVAVLMIIAVMILLSWLG